MVMEEIFTYEKPSNTQAIDTRETKGLSQNQKQKNEIKQYFINRAIIANEEYLQGRVTSQEDLIIESKDW